MKTTWNIVRKAIGAVGPAQTDHAYPAPLHPQRPPADIAGTFMVAGIQMPVDLHVSNVDAMCRLIEATVSVHPSTGMIVFSELAPFGPLLERMPGDPAAIERMFQDVAARYAIWLVPGSMFVRDRGEAIFNQAVVIDPLGRVAGRYCKMFPFLPFEKHVSAGSEFLVFDVPEVGRFGISICYDMWIPETTRTLAAQGVEVLLHPVLTGTTDRSAEIAIAQATAAMFQCYVVDVNGLMAGGAGRSLVADPGGRIVHQAGQTEEIFPVEIDLNLVRRARAFGANGLGQVLKSFRDRSVEFGVYAPGHRSPYLDALGPLAVRPRNAASPDMLPPRSPLV
jgi:predicted amidohydrolase